MLRRFSLLVYVLLTMVVVIATSSEAMAQIYGGSGRYRYDRRPSFSPWLDLFKADPGPLDNYNQYVRPKLELRNELRYQNRAINQLERRQSSLQNQVYSIRQHGAGAAPTGTGSTFMNYSHYYPMMGRGRR